MEKIIRTYIEKKYYKKILPTHELVRERDFLRDITNYEEGLVGFRYYDVPVLIEDDKSYILPEDNHSEWIYFGKRIDFDTFKLEVSENLTKGNEHSLMQVESEEMALYASLGYHFSICKIDAGGYKCMIDDDMTAWEYLEKINCKKRIKEEKL